MSAEICVGCDFDNCPIKGTGKCVPELVGAAISAVVGKRVISPDDIVNVDNRDGGGDWGEHGMGDMGVNRDGRTSKRLVVRKSRLVSALRSYPVYME